MLKFRNAFHEKLCMAILYSVGIVFSCLFVSVLSRIASQSDRIPMGVRIFSIAFGCTWILFFLSAFVFTKKVVVTKDKIVVKKYGRELWSLDSNDLKECRCSQITGEFVVMPFVRSMEFIVKGIDDDCAMWKNKKNYYHRCVIGLSVKNAKKMAEMGYNVSFPTPDD